ncbi:MAG: YwqI/YxiC family protein [Bacillota bacterium]|uniref:YwqI/YxiC family protein n=1 Tax=Virgibacillus salarius TaxID=447199 RepID=A0A941DW42_9BACI|nr:MULTISPECIES: YwqI/YxiC family protein [Bacillaceae]NAZ09235.1 hypothetical protein [Agaribacter marinus]MBR7796526.1 YwqI/YxiC family protein [Virgibacillus salarius]MCC2251701.1 YwqI/YxiC family protein [Virgibacillus sp. AGTR]MDY7043766.1 YwqI/YxiC family protein [Virgibacillus sp. M23]QRZ19429.1 YwqI/YxiC family protein [Virgibacillus sp. AGTR]
MSEEIKLNYAPIEKALANLRTNIQSLENRIPSDAQSDISLDMVNKVNEINLLLEDVLSSYQALLLTHEQETLEAVNQLLETEERIASNIQIVK